ncbi:MAG: diguanylate cyclase domain-containing protein [Bacillota bacterium]
MRKGKILIVIGIMITTIWLAFLFGVLTNYNRDVESFKQIRSQLLERSIESVTSSYEQFSNFIFETIVNNEETTAVLKQANEATTEEKERLRNELYQSFERIYTVSNRYQFRQLHFHLKDGESFLRMHAPDKYGDQLFDIRESVRLANEEQRYVTGFEEGRIFNGYRFVYPLYHEGGHIGSVEVSISLNSIIDILNDMYPTTVIGFILDRDVMEGAVFSDEQIRYQLSMVSEDYVIDKEVYQTQRSINTRLFDNQAFFQVYQQSLTPHLGQEGSFTEHFNNNGKDYMVVYLETLNIQGESVGYYSFVMPTNEFKNIVGTRNLVTATATVIYLLIIFMLYILYQRQQAMETLATRDPLTGLFNRHKFNQLVLRQLKNNQKNALMILDIDHFKRVNDTYGHNVGDEVLVALADRMTKVFDNGEIFARHGGEEFVVFFPNTSLAHAKIMADTLRRMIEYEAMPTVGQVTISIGLTNTSQHEPILQIIERADQALYEAKRQGRNKVIIRPYQQDRKDK